MGVYKINWLCASCRYRAIVFVVHTKGVRNHCEKSSTFFPDDHAVVPADMKGVTSSAGKRAVLVPGLFETVVEGTC